jgi:arsenite methyltransferase
MAREPETRDLMFQDEIKDTVLRAYGAIETGGGEAVALRLYSEEELAEVPPGAVSWALGVGNPVRYAFLQPGETVLDIGSGGGIDTILAARRVGPEGAAIGLDVVEHMLERARGHAAESGVAGWTEFISGEMEDIPLPDGSVDVVISNGAEPLRSQEPSARRDLPGPRARWADLTSRPDGRG